MDELIPTPFELMVQQAAKLREKNKAIKKDEMTQDWLLQTAEAEKYNLPDPSVYGNQADLFRKLSWVLLAVDLTAAAGALTPFEVARLIAGKEPKDIPNHEFELLLQKPNPIDSRFDFLYSTIAYWKLTGNAYWWLNRKDEFTPPDELWLIPSSMIIPVPDENLFIKGYHYYPGNGNELLLLPHEIVHFKRFNPLSRFVGLSAIEAIALVAAGDLGMQGWNTKLFKDNNARLPGIITFAEMINNDNWNDIKDNTREAARNRDLLMLRGAGAGGVQWLQNSVTQKEMEFLAGRKMNQEEIMTTLAPGSYSMLAVNATEANSRTGRASFNELTVYPMHVMMGEKITTSILPAYGGRQLIGKFEDIRVTDRQLELEEQKSYADVHTIEEIRVEFYGDDPLGDERDKLMPSELMKRNIAQDVGASQNQNVTQIASEGGAGSGVSNQQDKTGANQNNKLPQDNNQNQNKKQLNTPTKMELNDLMRWQRKALKKIGHSVPFDSLYISQQTHNDITMKLKSCKTADDVIKAFDIRKEIDMDNVELTVEAIKQVLNFKGRN